MWLVQGHPRSVSSIDPDDPGGTEKPGGVIKVSGDVWDGSPRAGSRGRAPIGVRVQSPRNGGLGRSPQKLNKF